MNQQDQHTSLPHCWIKRAIAGHCRQLVQQQQLSSTHCLHVALFLLFPLLAIPPAITSQTLTSSGSNQIIMSGRYGYGTLGAHDDDEDYAPGSHSGEEALFPADAYAANAAAANSPFADPYPARSNPTYGAASLDYPRSPAGANNSAGHAPQLSESFYAEAAQALSPSLTSAPRSFPLGAAAAGTGGIPSPAPAYSPRGPTNANGALPAHLPTLLADAAAEQAEIDAQHGYDAGAGGGEGAGGYTYFGSSDGGHHGMEMRGDPYTGVRLYDDPNQQHDYDPPSRGAGERFSPQSVYDDDKEIDYTPHPDGGINPFENAAGYIENPYDLNYGDVIDDDEVAAAARGYGASGPGSGFLRGSNGLPDALETQHFGPAPARGAQLRRHKTKKNVRLTQGNLVLDCPVPTKLQSFLTRRGEEEFMNMRYTAVTCDPDEFPENAFTLRPAMLRRHTEIFICVTMYNEDEVCESSLCCCWLIRSEED